MEYLGKKRGKGQLLLDGCKLFWHRDKLHDFMTGKRISPIHIDAGIHKGCNMGCLYCYGYYQKKSNDYIPEDRLLMLVDDAKHCGVRSMAVVGDGEPTLNSGLYPMAQRAKELNFDMSVATNGLLLDKKKIKILTDSLVWLRFNVSGVGVGYDKVHRTKSMFPKFESVIKQAVKYRRKCTIGLQMVLIPECFNQVVPLARKAQEWGVDYLVIKQFSDPESVIPVKFDFSRYAEAQEELKKAERLSTKKTRIIVKWGAMDDSANITKKKKWPFKRCIDLPFIFQISGNGGCYPCGYLFGNTAYCYGNVKTQRLSDILNSEHYWQIIDKISKIPLKKLCKGQCRHCETNKFVEALKEKYETCSDVSRVLKVMAGDDATYYNLIENHPAHINFV